MDTQICNECTETMPLDAFPFNKKYGRPEAKCKSCRNTRRRNGITTRIAVMDNSDGTRDCGTCGQSFEPCTFIKKKEYDCPDCRASKKKAYRAKNINKLKESGRAYKRRARIKELLKRTSQLRKLLSEDDSTLLWVHQKMRCDIERELSGYLKYLSVATAEEIAEAKEWQKKDRNFPPRVEAWVRRAVAAFERRQAARTSEELRVAQEILEELLKDFPEDDIRRLHREERKAALKASDRKRLRN